MLQDLLQKENEHNNGCSDQSEKNHCMCSIIFNRVKLCQRSLLLKKEWAVDERKLKSNRMLERGLLSLCLQLM